MNESLRSVLRISEYVRGSHRHVIDARTRNVLAIQSLARDGLAFGTRERQILFHKSQVGERIYLQFPGKESSSVTSKGVSKKPDSIRPWDFRPRFFAAGMETPGRDLEFSHIWAIAFENAAVLKSNGHQEMTRALAVIFYRMCYMLDHRDIPARDYSTRDVLISEDGDRDYRDAAPTLFPGHWGYSPNLDVIKRISEVMPRWGEMSFEAFLHYNELLAWNEDCKYYFRKYHILHKPGEWREDVGRINTIRSHIRILGHILGEVQLSDLLQGFVRGKGVCPVSSAELKRVLVGYSPEQD